MSGMKVLAFALFTVVQATSQEGPSSPRVRAECKFSDEKTITVDYSTRHVKVDPPLPNGEGWRTVFNDIMFVTDESLITVKGISVPAGDYTIVPGTDLHTWTLFMKKRTGGEFRVPMSVAKLASPAENSSISFEHTGGSCMMQLKSKNSNTQVSVEFTEKNADLPVLD